MRLAVCQYRDNVFFYRCAACAVGEVRNAIGQDNAVVAIGRNFAEVRMNDSIGLAAQAVSFNAVTFNRFGKDNAKPCVCGCCRASLYHDRAAALRRTLFEEKGDVLLVHAVATRKHVLNGETFSSLCPTAAENGASTFGLHALHEAMCSSPFAFLEFGKHSVGESILLSARLSCRRGQGIGFFGVSQGSIYSFYPLTTVFREG